jgi:hypothetical protein
MAIGSQLAAIVASQTGKIQGELEARVLSEAFKLTDKFTNQCPDIPGLRDIINTKNNLLKVVNSFTKLTNKFSSLANSLNGAIQAAKVLIQLLKIDPTPIAIGTPPFKDFGGLISSKTAGQQNSSADRLVKVGRLLEALEDDVRAIKSLVSGVDPSLNQVRKSLQSIDTNILNCVNDILQTNGTTIESLLSANTDTLNTNETNILSLIKNIQPSEPDTPGNVTTGEDFTYRNAQGIDYTLEIITVTEVERVVPGQEDVFNVQTEQVEVSYIAPKRYAQAKNRNGVIILRGPASFSSDTKILLDELKFRLDNQLA